MSKGELCMKIGWNGAASSQQHLHSSSCITTSNISELLLPKPGKPVRKRKRKKKEEEKVGLLPLFPLFKYCDSRENV